MERVFKIKSKTNPDPRELYPSERRYSASIVIGLSVVFFQLGLYSVLMGILIIHKVNYYETLYSQENITIDENNSLGNDTTELFLEEEAIKRLETHIERDLSTNERYGSQYFVDIPALLCAGCFMMALGQFLSFTFGLLAWKRWYIDHNITFFFLTTSFATLTSAICLLLSIVTSFNMDFYTSEKYLENPLTKSPITFSLAMNIIILSFVSSIWSFLSSRVSYRGMRNEYPDDMVVPKGGRRVEVSVIRKGSKNPSTFTFTPEMINEFQIGKLAKYLPTIEPNSNLPKEESSAEYQQRVNKFLNGENAHTTT